MSQMSEYVTVEMTNTPTASLEEKHLDAFADSLYEQADAKGPAASANFATGTLHMIGAVDVDDVARAVTLAGAAFRRALKAAGVKVGIGETVAYLGEPGRADLLDDPGESSILRFRPRSGPLSNARKGRPRRTPDARRMR